MNSPTKPTMGFVPAEAQTAAEAKLVDVHAQASVLQALAAAAAEPAEVLGTHHLVLPPGYQRLDFTEQVQRAQPRPPRKIGHAKFGNAESLLAYMDDQKAHDEALVFANIDTRTITCVFNAHRAQPGWGDHRASYQAVYTPEFKRWLDKNGTHFGQMEFAEFIEDNLADITEPAAQQLLDVATTIQAKSNISFGSARRLQDGQTQLQYTETIEASAGVGGALQIPREFKLGLRIFTSGEGYAIKARLKFRLNGAAVKFWYELDRPERAVEDAFETIVAKVSDASGYLTLLGSP